MACSIKNLLPGIKTLVAQYKIINLDLSCSTLNKWRESFSVRKQSVMCDEYYEQIVSVMFRHARQQKPQLEKVHTFTHLLINSTSQHNQFNEYSAHLIFR